MTGGWGAHSPGDTRVKPTFLRTGLIAALSFVAASAQAGLTFTFTDGSGGSILGEVQGLLDIAGTQTATGVLISSFTDTVGTSFPGSFTVPYVYSAGGSFTVVGGVLTTAVYSGFRAGNSATNFAFDLSAPSFLLNSYNNYANLGGSSLVFSSFAPTETVPEPGAALLVLTALAGMAGITRLNRRRTVLGVPRGALTGA